MNNNISAVINARVNSTRVPYKLIRPFSNTTLLDIALQKLKSLEILSKYVASCEPEIISIVNKYDIPVLHRDLKSVEKGFRDQRITFAHYSNVPNQYILCINPCCPFVNKETYEKAVKVFFKKGYRTLTTVKELNNIFLNEEMKPINASSLAVSTQENKPIYELSHLFHIFDRDNFLKNGYFWNYSENNPSFFKVSKLESYDIDDMIDFQAVEALYNTYTVGK